jgi:tetratricopeptide (TPR) repeat protein
MNLGAEQICFICLFALALLIVVLNDRIKERLVRSSERKKERPAREHLNYRTSWWLVLALAVAIGLFAAFQNNLPQLPYLRAIAIAAPITALAMCLIIFLVRRKRYRVLRIANDMVRQGDIEGAIALLREHIEHNPSSAPVYNHLWLLRGLQGKWDESLRVIEEAEQRFSKPDPALRANKGVALCKLGRLQEALPLLQEAARRFRRNLAATCNYGSVLAELGRHREALQQLRRADQLFASQRFFVTADVHRKHEELLESFRGLVTSGADK